MSKPRVLYISQHLTPYLPETTMSHVSRMLPQGTHEKGKEIRVFMPRFGKINERRHQLHEVIRLSGMNLSIDDTDHPLIIKVASIPTARIQVYFIDNDTYFKRKAVLRDDKGVMFADNDERSMFFVRGVLETVRQLGWAPDIVHCSGWMTSLVPLYLKHVFADEPYFAKAKVVYSAYDEGFDGSLDARMAEKVQAHGIPAEALECIADPTFDNLNCMAMRHADAVIVGSKTLSEACQSTLGALDKPILSYPGEDGFVTEINAFYDTILEGKTEAVAE
ncbi:MAG: glycogen/starch synthase [Bacteroidetes bacterium]|nr:glycogen/starch synthase [Bacteroidota bacterium]MDA0903843.1 glycogen/starch synthase [Bacteroidota bacterium]MDA1242863.1 glycogen/starch synthase [Bacteroidota bacterium]